MPLKDKYTLAERAAIEPIIANKRFLTAEETIIHIGRSEGKGFYLLKEYGIHPTITGHYDKLKIDKMLGGELEPFWRSNVYSFYFKPRLFLIGAFFMPLLSLANRHCINITMTYLIAYNGIYRSTK